jgi:8-oxo-dGTP pyrophosphatase MutT (NUDIX family)
MVDHKAALLARLRQPFPTDSDPRFRDLGTAPAEPARIRDAATVVLLRDGEPGRGVEAYLLKRASTMAFAGGMYVFPGGRVDPADIRDDVAWVGPPVAEVMHALHADPALARALVCAAVRETFEECGVLLAGPRPGAAGDASSSDLDSPDLLADRVALERRELSLATMLARRGLALRADLLRPWARWVTPEVEPRRYDTRFFVAALPRGQQPGRISGEADRMIWMRPADALEQHEAGVMHMLPPTAFTLAELCGYGDVDAILAAARARDLAPIMPKFLVTGGEAHFLLPHDEAYDAPDQAATGSSSDNAGTVGRICRPGDAEHG